MSGGGFLHESFASRFKSERSSFALNDCTRAVPLEHMKLLPAPTWYLWQFFDLRDNVILLEINQIAHNLIGSICRAVIPSLVPATLKSMSPR